MTDFLQAQRVALIADTETISDPVERFRKLDELAKLIERDIKLARAEIVMRLHEGHTWRQVGELLDVTGSRAEQLSRAAR